MSASKLTINDVIEYIHIEKPIGYVYRCKICGQLAIAKSGSIKWRCNLYINYGEDRECILSMCVGTDIGILN